ncbi:uncharacterized protein LOC132746511 [Ruditapes philippinarum]|uniref:uncharacterized protein LOC132746511 n=1 Tax=Ruditapes philippinarum TaxID=129788 RepID=UPI00295BDFDE|nr:uncharacterized protein LOC132746511 [Ruditapes philippinarum]
MSKQEDENMTAKLEELILKTKAEIYQCFKWLLWICCISVGLLACWVGKVQYYAVVNTNDGSDNIHKDSRYKSFKAFDQDRDGFISEPEFEQIHSRLINTQPKVSDELKRIEEEQGKLHALINDLQLKLTDSELAQWGPWSTWSDCYMNCTGKHGGRLQNRSRETNSKSVVQGHQKETEERPCNAVQFAGCIKSYGTDDNFGVNYDFADQMAVSTCTALSDAGYIYAVRRRCSSLSVSCEETCKQIGGTCINSLHIYRGSQVLLRDVDGSKGLYVYKYNSCAGEFCGPNFCCCRSSKP